MSVLAPMLPGFQPSDRELVASLPLHAIVDRAVKLLRDHEPQDGYYLAFSGGKDSCVIKRLCQRAGVKFDSHYNNTTIDAPELVRFVKLVHPDAEWSRPACSMMHRLATRPGTPPTRRGRWCCSEYKERGGENRVKVFGVRAAESKGRAKNWREWVDFGDTLMRAVAAPICYWTTEQVWEFIHAERVPYCELYDEGWDRLGCVGCPLNPASQAKEFARWPRYEANWRKAIIANWQKHHAAIRRDGQRYYHAKFRSGDEFWQWWRYGQPPVSDGDTCMSELLWTNE